MLKITLTMQPDGNFLVEYPLDKPAVTLIALEGAMQVVRQQAAQREMQPAVQLATQADVPPALRQRLNGR